jgi:hypothetical protein
MDEDKVREDIEKRKLEMMQRQQALEERRFAAEQKQTAEQKKIEREKLKVEKRSMLSEGFSRSLQKTKDVMKNNASLGTFLIVFGLITHIIHGIGGFKILTLHSPLMILYITVAAVIVVFRSLEDKKEIARTGIVMLCIVGFEYLFYSRYFFVYDAWVSDPATYWFLWKAFWNAWIYAGVFLTLSAEKKPVITKWLAIIIIFFIIFSAFNWARLSKQYAMPEVELPKEAIEESKQGFLQNLKETIYFIQCITNPDQETCITEKRWADRRANFPEEAEAMEELCRNGDPKCDCHVYAAGKQRDDCEKIMSEARLLQTTAAVKKLTATKLDFEGDATKQTYEKIIGINPRFTLLSPYKELDITIDCSIKNSSKAEVADNFEVITIPKERTKTGDTPYTRIVECLTAGEVAKGEYTFEMSAMVNNIVTNADYIGLYTDPGALFSYDPKNPDPVLKASYDNQIKTRDKFPTGKVESFSDPDMVLLSFYVEPIETRDASGLEGLAGMKSGSEFNLRVVVKNNKDGSNITDVSSLKFEIPNIFDVDASCLSTYSRSDEGDKIILTANADRLKAAGIEKITYGKEGKVLLGLSCKLIGNIDMSNLANAYEFKGSITYSQIATKKFKVMQIG